MVMVLLMSLIHGMAVWGSSKEAKQIQSHPSLYQHLGIQP